MNPSASFEQIWSSGLAASLAAQGAPRRLRQAAEHASLGADAKRLRPKLVLGFGEHLGAPPARLAPIAVAAELIHTASLIHDDIVDQADTRRGTMATHRAFGRTPSVLAGDWLLAQALFAIAPCDEHVRLRAAEVLSDLSRAAIGELEYVGQLNVAEATWEDIARGKTGALLGWCLESAAVAAGRPALAPPLRAFGEHLGVLFQRADDLRDVVGVATGKPRFADLRNKNLSLVTLLAARTPALAAAIRSLWQMDAPTPSDLAFVGEQLAAAPSTLACMARLRHELAELPARYAQITTASPQGDAMIAAMQTLILANLPEAA